MADPAVKFTQNAAKQIQKTVKGYLAEPNDQTPVQRHRQTYMKPAVMYCKIASDYAGGATTISATPCDSAGTVTPGCTAISFDLSGHQVEQQCYGNLLAGDIVRYNPYTGIGGGMICHMPIVATSSLYAVMQVGTASTRVVFDFVRAS